MYKPRAKNTVRYYLLLAFALLFLFFSNDFGLIDVQKTAIVMAVGIDREADSFIVTSQIAIPQSSTQGKATEAVQIVSRGKTVGEALEEINAKTGWYPKLVFCDLIILGETTVQHNVFDALDFFLRDEYMSDNCLVATCNGSAKALLNTSALVDPSGSVAMRKVLSPHAERVGTVLPITLREFAIGYFSDSQSGFLPILQAQPTQENKGEKDGNAQKQQQSKQENSSSTAEGSQNTQKQSEKPLFSARETALFVGGKQVEKLNKDETFALAVLLNKLRLASYSVPLGEKSCALTIKQNSPKISLKADEADQPKLSLHVTLTAGVMDLSAAQSITEISDAGKPVAGSFSLAEQKLALEIQNTFQKTQACGCDVFGVRERWIKHQSRRLQAAAPNVLKNTTLDVKVTFRNIR